MHLRLLLLVSVFSTRVGAQATTSAVEGLVRSGNNAPLTGARVEIKSRETGALRSALTDGRGSYRIYGVTPGSYDIVARAIGYRPQRRDSVDLVIDEASRVDFVLAANPNAFELDPVVVRGSASRDAERMDVSNAVLEREIEELPLNSRDALALAAITPGVRAYSATSGRTTATTGAPTSGRSVNLYVDGGEWKGFNGIVGQPSAASLFPQEAIREFRVVLNPYDVEFGHGGTWVMSAVTHQGTNDVHGSLFAYGQNPDLIARSSTQTVKPDYSRRQIGANLRGPIVRDHLFYAVSYEEQVTNAYVDVVPTRPAYAPNVFSGYAGTFRAPYNNQTGLARLTGQWGSHVIDATFTDRRLTNLSNFGTLASGVLQSYDAALLSTYTIASTQLRDRWSSGALVNELSLTYVNDHEDDEPRMAGPVYQYPDLQTLGRTSYPLIGRSRSTALGDGITYALHGAGGEHALKAGAIVTRVWSEAFQPLSADGFFKFPTDTSTLPIMAQIGIGYPDPSTTSGAGAGAYAWTTSGYVQDQWSPTLSLRLTAGVRYDADINSLDQGYTNPWRSDTTLQRIFGDRYLDARHRKNDLDNIAPRLAASWDIGGAGRTFIRAGYGRMYDRIPRTATFYERVSYSWRVYNFTNPGTTDPAALRQLALSSKGGTLAAPQVQVLPDRLETPQTDEWSAGIGRRLTSHLMLQMDYLAQQLSRLPVTVRMNAGTQHRLTNGFGPIVVWGSFGDASYRALLSTLTYERGATRVTAAYTLGWSKAEFFGNSDAAYPDTASYNMQWAGTDERHRVVLSGIANGPWGLRFSTIATVASPHPYAVFLGTDANGTGTPNDDWPNGIRSARPHGWANWYRNVDMRIGKAIGAARGRLVATADVFNLFNTANHSDFRNMANQADYGQPIGDYARRQAQVGLRYQF